ARPPAPARALRRRRHGHVRGGGGEQWPRHRRGRTGGFRAERRPCGRRPTREGARGSGGVRGWDSGGATPEGARVVGGAGVAAVEAPFARRREPGRRPAALARLAARVDGGASAMAVTMTAELPDCFATKREGVT